MARFLLISVLLIAVLVAGTSSTIQKRCFGPGEVWYDCGPCDSTCGEEVACAAICRPPGGCGCRRGYVRNDFGMCIPKNFCPWYRRCGKNEQFYPCGSCDSGCDYAVDCVQQCRIGSCGCKPGYVRDKNRVCIKESMCPKPLTCGKNEEVKGCGRCDSTCREDIMCTLQCREPECGCIKDHVRDDNNNCILKSKCPKYKL